MITTFKFLSFAILSLCTTTLLGEGSSASTFNIPPPPVLNAPSMLTMPVKDRKNNGANPAAIAAAAMQGMSCLMMMKMAQEQEDPKMKQLMMMMAMQQCAQAAATAANAKENKDSADAAGDAPKQDTTPKMEAPDFKMPDSPKEETKLASLPPDTGSNPSPPTIPDLTTPDLVKKDAPKIALSDDIPAPKTNGPIVPQTTVPKSIETTKLGYDESGKSGAGPSSLSPMPSGSMPNGKLSDPAALAKAEGASSEDGSGKGRKRFVEGAPPEVGSSNGGGEGKPEGPNPLDSMLALLGGDKSGQEGALAGPGGELAAFGDSKPEEKKMNIFEYASHRYNGLHQEGRIRVKPGSMTAKNAAKEPGVSMAQVPQ